MERRGRPRGQELATRGPSHRRAARIGENRRRRPAAVSSLKGSDDMYARVAPFESDPSRVDDAIRRALPTTNPIAARQLELNAIDPRLPGAGVRYVRVLYARAADATTRRAKNGSGEPSRRRDSNPRPPLYEGDLGPGTE